jgi:hypothetical protein
LNMISGFDSSDYSCSGFYTTASSVALGDAGCMSTRSDAGAEVFVRYSNLRHVMYQGMQALNFTVQTYSDNMCTSAVMAPSKLTESNKHGRE